VGAATQQKLNFLYCEGKVLQHTGIAVVGSGSAVPPTTLTNAHLCQMVDTSEEWIGERTGIHQRHLNDGRSSLTELATKAALEAITMAKLQPMDIDLIILATSTADDMFGSASSIQFALGATRAVAFDLTAACSGFIFGLVTCAQFLQTGTYGTALLIGGDVLSRWVDWSDRRTCILFGDGAGAVVLQPSEDDTHGILTTCMHADGTHAEELSMINPGSHGGYHLGTEKFGYPDPNTPGGVFVTQKMVDDNLLAPNMTGQLVFKTAVVKFPEDISWLVPHQANLRIIDATANRMGLGTEKVMINIERFGNTTAATIPLCLWEWENQLKKGDNIILAAFGGGFTWGAIWVKWAYDTK